MPESNGSRPRGRPPGASPEAVVAEATRRYLRGERVDVQAIAAEVGVGRATVYRWFGSRDGLLAEVLIGTAAPLLAAAHREASGRGAERLLATFDAFNRALTSAEALRRFIETEREAALRLLTASGGPVQPRIVALVAALIEEEVATGAYDPPVDPETLAYAVVRLSEAFLYSDVAVGLRGDVERLREVEAALLGVR